MFAELNHLKTTNSRTTRISGKFEIIYSVGNNKYRFANHDFGNKDNKTKAIITCNGENIPFKKIQLPSNIIALSNTITDKFFVDISDYKEYYYLGVKTNNNTARTSTFVIRTINLLYETLTEKDVYNHIGEALNFLDYEKRIVITYYPRYKHHFFKGNLTEEMFHDFF